MDICIVSLELDTFGGAERVVISDANYFAAQNHDVSIVAEAFDADVLAEYDLSSSVNTHEYTVDHWLPLWEIGQRARALRTILNQICPDAVVVHYREKSVWAALRSLQLDLTLVAHVHGSVFWLPIDSARSAHEWRRCAKAIVDDVQGHSEFWSTGDVSLPRKLHSVATESLETLALRSCDTVFANTQQVARELHCLYNINAEVNPPGVPTFPDRVTVANQKESIPIDSPFIFSLSRLDKRKRIDLLLEAFAELQSSNPDILLAIGGTGEEEESLKSLAADLGLADSVRFVGHIDETSISAYYAAAEVFACPGWMSYGLTPLEAVRARTKVAISTDAHANELIESTPGVEVLPPAAPAWVEGLSRLLLSDKKPSPDNLPTVEGHAEIKLRTIEQA